MPSTRAGDEIVAVLRDVPHRHAVDGETHPRRVALDAKPERIPLVVLPRLVDVRPHERACRSAACRRTGCRCRCPGPARSGRPIRPRSSERGCRRCSPSRAWLRDRARSSCSAGRSAGARPGRTAAGAARGRRPRRARRAVDPLMRDSARRASRVRSLPLKMGEKPSGSRRSAREPGRADREQRQRTTPRPVTRRTSTARGRPVSRSRSARRG